MNNIDRCPFKLNIDRYYLPRCPKREQPRQNHGPCWYNKVLGFKASLEETWHSCSYITLYYDCFSGVGLLFPCRSRRPYNAEHGLLAFVKERNVPSVRGGGCLPYSSGSSHTRYPQRGHEATPTIGHLLFLINANLSFMSVFTPKRIYLELLSRKSTVAMRMAK